MEEAAASVRARRDRPDDLDVRDRRAHLHPDPGRARRTRLPGAGRRGQHRRPPGVRLGGGGGGLAPARTAAAADAGGARPRPGRSPAGLSNADKLSLAGSPYPSVADLLEDCVAAAVDDLVDRHGGPVWDEAAYDGLLAAVAADLDGDHPCGAARRGAGARRVARGGPVAQRLGDLHLLPALADMQAQVDRLVHRGFVGEVGVAQLRHLPRYLGAVADRRARLDDVGRPGPAADGPGGRACRRPTCTGWPRCRRGECPAPGWCRCAGCSRSTAGQPVGPGAGHGVPGLRHPDPQGPRRRLTHPHPQPADPARPHVQNLPTRRVRTCSCADSAGPRGRPGASARAVAPTRQGHVVDPARPHVQLRRLGRSRAGQSVVSSRNGKPDRRRLRGPGLRPERVVVPVLAGRRDDRVVRRRSSAAPSRRTSFSGRRAAGRAAPRRPDRASPRRRCRRPSSSRP